MSTVRRSLSTLVVLLALVATLGASASAQTWRTRHDNGRHRGWARARYNNSHDDWRYRRGTTMSRQERGERRVFRRDQRIERRTFRQSGNFNRGDRRAFNQRERVERARFNSRERAERRQSRRDH